MNPYCFIRKNTAELCSALEELGLVCWNLPALPDDEGISLAHDSIFGGNKDYPNCYLNVNINNPALEKWLLEGGYTDCGTDEKLFLFLAAKGK